MAAGGRLGGCERVHVRRRGAAHQPGQPVPVLPVLTLRDDFKSHVAVFATLVAVVAVPFAANYMFLLRADEVSRYSTIVREQFARSGIYASALNGNDLKYKIELIRRVKPEIVVIGSSRAMNLRDLVFTRPFVNAGGVSSNLLESETFVSEMLKVHVPKLVLYFVDYWWFNPKYEQGPNRYSIDETSLSYVKLTSPFSWIWEGKITWDLYRDILLRGRHENLYTRFDTLGVSAIELSIGYRTDGSFLNSRGLKQNEGVIKYYWDELKSIDEGRSERVNLGLGSHVDETLVQRYVGVVERMRKRGVDVIVVVPPVAPRYLQSIRAHSKMPYVLPVVARLNKFVAPIYDFTDFPAGQDADCEYADGYHAGDVLSLRMLKAILERTPGSPLSAYVDAAKLDDYIRRFAGRAFIVEPASMYKSREFDFLGLGCSKKESSALAAGRR
jgi:hypothetical protein